MCDVYEQMLNGCLVLSFLVQESGARRGGGGAGRGAAEDLDDSAMSAYDPYGRHKSVYRGIRLHEDTDRKAQVTSNMRSMSVKREAFIAVNFS
jgi:hypothetical protein